MTKVKVHLAKIIKGQHISVLELDEHIDDISEGLKQAINPELAEYGLEMPEFYVSNILTPEDDPNFRRMKQQYADQYLKVREEEIRKAEAEAAFERKAVEAQTAARMKVIGAQGEADATRIKAQAEAEAYQMQAQAEAAEMKMKGYTYQQETARQVGIEAMRNAGSGSLGAVSGIAGEMMQLGVGLGAASSVIGMTKDAMTPIAGQMIQQMSAPVVPAASVTLEGWTCPTCGKTGIGSAFCPDCGGKKPEMKQEPQGWTCPTCGKNDNSSPFCPDCGCRKPEIERKSQGWTCPACGKTEINSLFCPDCGKKKGE